MSYMLKRKMVVTYVGSTSNVQPVWLGIPQSQNLLEGKSQSSQIIEIKKNPCEESQDY